VRNRRRLKRFRVARIMCVALVSPNNALASKQFGVAFGINRRVANGRINRFVTHEALNQPQVCPSIYQVVTPKYQTCPCLCQDRRYLCLSGSSAQPLNWIEYMTSDHRVAGSSPAGCRASVRVDLRAIRRLKKKQKQDLHSRFIRTF
jgi:hypothetical protein